MRKIRGKEISIIFQDPMTSLNPVLYHRKPDHGGNIRLHTDKNKKAGIGACDRDCWTLVGINEPEKPY